MKITRRFTEAGKSPYENIPFLNSSYCRPVRLQLEYLHPEVTMHEQGVKMKRRGRENGGATAIGRGNAWRKAISGKSISL